ncbi:hypothetical protein OJ997_28235 [Solirubrobacter phytolaccae]|uniref:Uncharacterized protein n=1 Tax=Solirubrobacter phytolaccae TaxID=1404360 RepID=A0A9X3NDU0_9ACTN|nr:hypothetical protein [Solirubrobacter phytolaccae]MDA0184231.1 hypothetical protein [Solirubrobacter phytolaccae]
MKLAKTARNLAVADIALAFARDRVAAMVPGVEPRKKRRPGAKTLLLGGGVAAAVAALFFKRDSVKGLLPGGSSDTAPAPEPDAYTPPPVSNYDASGPVANTATSVPVPPAFEEPAIDEAAEEAAAAAEAANIGGSVSDYAGPEGEIADEAFAPLAEAGEGESEGEEQAEDELRIAAESDEGTSDAQHQIEDAIEAADNPTEQIEPVKPGDDSEWNTWSGRSVNP